MNIWIKNGTVIDPAEKREGIHDILIQNGRISVVGTITEEMAGNCTIVDATDRYIMPGFIDLHVHFREPGLEYKETIATGTRAAARGGFTGVCPMPNTVPSTDCAEMVERVLLINEKDGCGVHLYPVGAVTVGQAGEEKTDVKAMKDAGAKAISEDGKSVMNAAVYTESMLDAAENNIPVFAHCEDKNLVGKGAMNAGKKAEELGIEGIRNAVEDVIVARDILLAHETGAKLHLCHCSTKDSVEMVRIAKQKGWNVTGEVCPHHFVMSDEDIKKDDGNYKMNPPLRSREDVQALIRGLSENVMDVIATDHAPHSQEEKEKSIQFAPFGIVGLETAFPLTVTYLVKKGHLTLSQMVEKLSVNPAAILGVEGGTLREGAPADLVIANLDEKYQIDKNTFFSKGKNTPFDGLEVYGKIEKTMVAGRFIYEER